MKAVVFDRHGGPEVLEYKEVPVPEIGPNDVLLRVKALGFNYNDVWARVGVPGMDFPFPHICGTDASGIIEKVGAGVTRFRPGDEVAVNGSFGCGECFACLGGNPFDCPDFKIWGFQTGPLDGAQAEFAKVPARCLVPKPANLNFVEAASFCVALGTVWRMLVVRAKVKYDDYVLIWGASGGVGSMAIQVCRLLGAHPIAVAGSDEKLKFCKDLGAEYVINRKTQRVLREVMKITNKRGVDVVFEHTGQDTWETGCLALRWGGTIVTCGATSGYKAPLDIRFLWMKQQNYLGSHCCTVSEFAESLKYVERGLIKPVVNEVMPLTEIKKAHEALEKSEVTGKIVLVP